MWGAAIGVCHIRFMPTSVAPFIPQLIPRLALELRREVLCLPVEDLAHPAWMIDELDIAGDGFLQHAMERLGSRHGFAARDLHVSTLSVSSAGMIIIELNVAGADAVWTFDAGAYVGGDSELELFVADLYARVYGLCLKAHAAREELEAAEDDEGDWSR